MSKRNVLITGCSSGIGQALAQRFAKQGDAVIATARKPESMANLAALGCRTLALDVNDAQSRQQLADQLSGQTIDILVHNAGISAMGPLLELPEDKLRGQFETNVIAPVLLTRALFPLMRGSSAPLIVNIGSVSGILTTPFAGAYCASKAALHAISDAMRMELAPFGFQVTTVQPGAIQSNFGAAATANVTAWLDDNSLYAAIRDGILARAGASQVNATPAEDFADELVRQLSAGRAPRETRIGHGSRTFPALKRWLPGARLDRVLSGKFGLDKLTK